MGGLVTCLNLLSNVDTAMAATFVEQPTLLVSEEIQVKEIANPPITEQEVIAFENEWGQRVIDIGKAYENGRDYQTMAIAMAIELYGYGETDVQFKPTKALDMPFRPRATQALSYFVGGEVPEDHGFALKPWKKVRFDNNSIRIVSDMNEATAQGNYYFTTKNDDEVQVEYTMGMYRSPTTNKLKLYLHDSHFPLGSKFSTR